MRKGLPAEHFSRCDLSSYYCTTSQVYCVRKGRELPTVEASVSGPCGIDWLQASKSFKDRTRTNMEDQRQEPVLLRGRVFFVESGQKPPRLDTKTSSQDPRDPHTYILKRVHIVQFALKKSTGERRLLEKFRPSEKRERLMGKVTGGWMLKCITPIAFWNRARTELE